MRDQQTVAFFIGSGCSFPSGQPSVDTITGNCLRGEYFLLEPLDETSGFFAALEGNRPRWGTERDLRRLVPKGRSSDLDPWRRPAASVQALLTQLSQIDLWNRQPNYEDLAGVLNIVAGSLAQQLNDPCVEALIRQTDLLTRLDDVQFPDGHRYFSNTVVQKIVFIEDFIGWVIAKTLRNRVRLTGYEPLTAAIRFLAERRLPFHVVTTNYDCNLERLFRHNRIIFRDGLIGKVARDDHHRWIYGNHFEFADDGLPWLIKLHGSVNWFLCHAPDSSGARVLAQIGSSIDPLEAYASYFSIPSGPTFTPLGCPEMLRGSLSKSAAYSYDIYSQLLLAFERVLERASVCVIAGFGWSDEAIVARLMRFVRTDGKALLVFDGAPGEPAISRSHLFDPRMVRDARNRQSLILVREHLSDVAPEQCVRYLREAIETASKQLTP